MPSLWVYNNKRLQFKIPHYKVALEWSKKMWEMWLHFFVPPHEITPRRLGQMLRVMLLCDLWREQHDSTHWIQTQRRCGIGWMQWRTRYGQRRCQEWRGGRRMPIMRLYFVGSWINWAFFNMSCNMLKAMNRTRNEAFFCCWPCGLGVYLVMTWSNLDTKPVCSRYCRQWAYNMIQYLNNNIG